MLVPVAQMTWDMLNKLTNCGCLEHDKEPEVPPTLNQKREREREAERFMLKSDEPMSLDRAGKQSK